MTLSERDKKIVIFLVPLLVLVGYWFLLLAPKRQEASKAGDELAKQQQRLQSAQQQLSRLNQTKATFASDYRELARLGKAVPSTVDMPSLIVQLDSAARGTGVRFTKIAKSDEQTAAPTTAGGSQGPKAPGTGNGSQPAAAGGQQAASGPGKAAESAGNATNAGNARSSAAEKSGVQPGDAQTSTSSGAGLPVGGGAAAGAAGAPPALNTVPLQLEFKGDFFKLADFFHRLKRFVRVVNDRVLVGGRLMTVDKLKFVSDPQDFPKIKAEIGATVYLSPKAQGPTAGATPQGPQPTPPAGGSTPAGAGAGPAATPPTAASSP